jgi:predicted HAD superfamily Cof-like phosphohydrolase
MNMIGEKFCRLTVLAKNNKKSGKSGEYWDCICQCGKTKTIRGYRLKKGLTKSCGCLVKEVQKKRLSKPPGAAAKNHVINSYKHNAGASGVKFNLTRSQFIKLCESPCHYCGKMNSNCSKSINGDWNYNGIDRVDSCIGYSIENCVPCCKFCNFMKKDLDYNEFTNWVKKAYNHLYINTSNKMVQSVVNFHRAYNQPILTTPKIPNKDRQLLRLNLIEEELIELKEAFEQNNIVEVADALIDLQYVIIGCAIENGLHTKLDTCFDEVHASNMSKLGPDGKPIHRQSDGKVLKGPNFFKPKLKEIINNEYR